MVYSCCVCTFQRRIRSPQKTLKAAFGLRGFFLEIILLLLQLEKLYSSLNGLNTQVQLFLKTYDNPS